MKKKVLLAGVCALMAVPTLAQDLQLDNTGRKWDGGIEALLTSPRTARSTVADSLITTNVSVNDAEAVADFVRKQGHEATIITPNLVVITLPVRMITELGAREDVLYMNTPKQYRPLLAKARPETGVTKIQEGTGLETPFTGKGVLIGVIDQGFEFSHAAFLNRVDRYCTSSTGMLTTTPPRRDSYDQSGHATHVTNIAAGSKVGNNNYYGFATGARLILVSSKFDNSDVLKQAKSIKDYADENGMPWVINMSFGGLTGPHDGTTEYDKAMSELCGPGALMVAAMGNEGGEKLHAQRTIADANTPVYLNMKPDAQNKNKGIISEIWSEATDGQEALNIQLVLVTRTKTYELSKLQLANAGCRFETGINPYNKRQYATFKGFLSNIQQELGGAAAGTAYLCWKVTGKGGETFHAWLDGVSYLGEFAKLNMNGITAEAGDDNYLVAEGAASIPTAIAVASYNNADSYRSINGETYSYASFIGSRGSISKFSSRGPQIVSRPKPAIAAPGGCVISAYSKNSTNFSSTSNELVEELLVNGQKYYYGVMNGTSMASPAVTGIIALWLEANPKLTYDQVIEIFQKTGRRSNQTGEADANGWNATAGYGKIDAYEGLKMALEMANETGINEVINTEAPVSIQKEQGAWKVLFNNDETYADLQVYATNGTLVKSVRLNAPRRGEEHVVSLTDMTPGVYLFRVATTASQSTRKMIVK